MLAWPRKVVIGFVCLLVFGVAAGQEQPSATAGRKLIVGTKHTPPFAIKSPGGTWSGISIDLWRGIAEELQLSYEFRERDLQGLLDGVKDGSLDAAVAALTVTAEREQSMDFTHPLHSTGLSIAALPGKKAGWLRLLGRFASARFLTAIAALAVLLLVVGFLAWLLERRRNPAQFGGGPARGIGAGFWWSAVTMTTVGYGDKAPVSLGGRLLAIIWMFTALIVVATFTGAIASALTVGQLEAAIAGPQDLPKVRVGTVAGSTSESYLRGRHISHRAYPSAADGLRSVAGSEIDAFVYDAPLLRYLANIEMGGAVSVLPATFERQDYAIALPDGSRLREPINRALLKTVSRPAWRDTLNRYMGK